MVSLIATFLIIQAQGAEPLSNDARVWDQRQAEIKRLSHEVNRTLSRNSRAVRRGSENTRVDSLIVSQIQTTNQRLKKQGAYVLVSENGQAPEKRIPLTAHEIEQVLASMDPYRREFAEGSLQTKGMIGILLVGRALTLVDLPSSLESKAYLDLENFEKSGDRKFDEMIKNFQRRGGTKFYVLILPKVDLPDASFSASGNFTVEQMKDGNINVYQERLKTRRADSMAAQVFSSAPRNLLFVQKSDLQKALGANTILRSFVLNTYADIRAEILSETPAEEDEPAPPEPTPSEADASTASSDKPEPRFQRFDVKGE